MNDEERASIVWGNKNKRTNAPVRWKNWREQKKKEKMKHGGEVSIWGEKLGEGGPKIVSVKGEKNEREADIKKYKTP